MKPVFSRRLLLAGLCSLALAAVAACDDDDDAPTTPTNTGSISGTVTFVGNWPASGNVQISLFSTFPPMGPPDAFTDPIPQGATYDFRLDGIEPGTYAALVVGWRDDALPPPANATCNGMYWIYPDSVGIAANCVPDAPGPSPVTVVKGVVLQNLDMTADLEP